MAAARTYGPGGCVDGMGTSTVKESDEVGIFGASGPLRTETMSDGGLGAASTRASLPGAEIVGRQRRERRWERAAYTRFVHPSS